MTTANFMLSLYIIKYVKKFFNNILRDTHTNLHVMAEAQSNLGDEDALSGGIWLALWREEDQIISMAILVFSVSTSDQLAMKTFTNTQ